MNRMIHLATLALLLSPAAARVNARHCASTASQQPSSPHLAVSGGVTKPLDLSADDLKHLPRTTLKTVNPHSQKSETYEGVSLHELLHRAGVPEGENLRGPAMTTYVVAEASDGYRVVFSVAELDPGIADSEVLVADTLDGAPLDPRHGPFEARGSTRQARRTLGPHAQVFNRH